MQDEDAHDEDARIQLGEGYPHEAVPGRCCCWATDELQATGISVRSSQPPLNKYICDRVSGKPSCYAATLIVALDSFLESEFAELAPCFREATPQ